MKKLTHMMILLTRYSIIQSLCSSVAFIGIAWVLYDTGQLEYCILTILLGAVFIHLNHLVVRDSLTGLFNRRKISILKICLAVFKGYLFSVIMIDVDYFKALNKAQGHIGADEELKRLARLLVRSVRQHDIVCRYGGDEFIVFMPLAMSSDAKAVATRLLATINHSDLMITVSVGAACSLEYHDLDETVKAADQALYEAKSIRNCYRFLGN